MIRARALCGAVLVFVAAGCIDPGTPASPGEPPQRTFRPIDIDTARFWDRQSTETRDLLLAIAADFNAGRERLPIAVEHVGGYSDIYRKVSASIQAGLLPAMAVAYESMTAEYIRAGAAASIDGFVNDPEWGLSEEELADFFPVAIETNRYTDYGGAMFSFPFSKSVLMLYFNKRVLAEAGLTGPPDTWDEFLDHCRTVKAKTGKFALAVSVDASTIDGMVYSMGGEVYANGETLFDRPEAVGVFELFETLAREELAYQIPPGTYDDEAALANDEVAFTMRSSSGRTSVQLLMEGRQDEWGMARIPQADPANPRTVLFGPNIVIFNTTPEQQQAAWEFVRYFTAPEQTVRWAIGTGYLPIRKSVANDPGLQAFWNEWPYNRAAYDCLAFARSEPNVAGWQEVRAAIEAAQTAVLNGSQTALEAATTLKHEADRILQRR